MKSYEMVETLSKKAHVSLEQAKEALENSNWDILDAAIYLERRGSAGAPPTQNSAPGAYYVSGGMPDYQGSYATPGFGREGPFDPRVDFNRPHGGVPPYKDFPKQAPPVPPYKDFPRQAPVQPPFGHNPPPPPPYGAPPVPPKNPYDPSNMTIGETVGKLAGFLERIVNGIFGLSFVVNRHGQSVMSIPLLIFIIVAIMFLPFVILLLVLGAAFDCRYTFSTYNPLKGRTIEDVVENAVHTAFNTAEKAKETIMNEAQNAKVSYEQTKKDFAQDFQKGRESVTINLNKTPVAPAENADKPADNNGNA